MKRLVLASLTNNRFFLGVIHKTGQCPIGIMMRSDGSTSWVRLKFRRDIKAIRNLGYIKKFDEKQLRSMLKIMKQIGMLTFMRKSCYNDKWMYFPFYFQLENMDPLTFAYQLSLTLQMDYKIRNWNPFTIEFFKRNHKIVLILGRRHVIVRSNNCEYKFKRSSVAEPKYKHFKQKWQNVLNVLKTISRAG